MNASLHAFPPRPLRMAPFIRRGLGRPLATSVLGIALLGALGACSSVSVATKERVAQSDASVRQAQSTLGQSEYGAVELQQARESLAAAKAAIDAGNGKEAERAATQAHLYAELAVARSRSATARKAADEVLASVETLRRETERNSPPMAR